MTYCNNSKKATVYYSFADRKQIYITDSTPININVKVVSNLLSHDGQCLTNYHVIGTATVSYSRYFEFRPNPYGKPYILKFDYDTRILGTPIPGRIVSVDPRYDVGWTFGGSSGGYGLPLLTNKDNTDYYYGVPAHTTTVLTIGEGDFNYYVMSYNEVLSVDITQVIRIDGLLDDCGEKNKTCEITIKTSDLSIFKDRGICPCKFDVACDDECPDGYLKCSQVAYPGYCCIPCDDICQGLYSVAKNIV